MEYTPRDLRLEFDRIMMDEGKQDLTWWIEVCTHYNKLLATAGPVDYPENERL